MPRHSNKGEPEEWFLPLLSGILSTSLRIFQSGLHHRSDDSRQIRKAAPSATIEAAELKGGPGALSCWRCRCSKRGRNEAEWGWRRAGERVVPALQVLPGRWVGAMESSEDRNPLIVMHVFDVSRIQFWRLTDYDLRRNVTKVCCHGILS